MGFTYEELIIKYLRQKYNDGRKRILNDHPEKTEWAAGGIDNLLRIIDETGGIERAEGSGRPKTARTQENIEEVESLILSQEGAPGTHMTPREISLATGISHTSVARIIDNDLQLRPLKKIKCQVLNDDDCEKRMERVPTLLRLFSNSVLETAWFSDEKLFKLHQLYNRQNERVYAAKDTKKCDVDDERVLAPTKRFAPSVMVSAAISKLGKTPIFFVEPGVKINGEYYRNTLLRKMIPAMNKISNGKEYIFMQDGARSHTAKDTIAFLRDRVPNLLEPEQWPPNSPDLNPLDYSVWSVLEAKVYRGRIITDVETLKKAITTEWKNLPQEVVDNAINAFRPRLRRVVQQNGGHIERFM